MRKIELNIKGMHCASCTMLVKDALTGQKGVKSAIVDLKRAVIEYDEKETDERQLIRIIGDEGYKVVK
ncbi:MAG TPA: heavy metal-associated domain-containing protein [Candidatus Nanoarchaeia archaeon]|nr:heavy metal-associated domain-containing protein [Candidatus Nanoarchaeia archaeon]